MATATCLGALLYLVRLGGISDEAAQSALFQSPLGAALALQLTAGLLVAITARAKGRLVGAVGVLLSFGVVGHAASRGLTSSLAVVLHVAAAAWWFGGLWVLLFASKALERRAFALLVARFSRQAIWVVAALFVAGATTAALLLDLKIDLAQPYTQLLLVKAGILAILLALATFNKFVLGPRLAYSGRTLLRIRRTICAEIFFVAWVFVATAWLTTYLSPHATDGAVHAHTEQVQVDGPITIIDPWAPAMFGGAKSAAGYMVIVNRQPVDDRLLSVTSPWAEQVTLHATIDEGGISKMRDLDFLAIPPGKRIALTPGVYHLMFTNLFAEFVEGDDVPISLHFAHAGKVDVMLKVRKFAEIGDTHHHEE
ncbi:MAG: copper chaperone PCu(A)C [Casimicrobium sp.]